MNMRGICVIFVFTVGLIGVVNVHACAEPDPAANGFQHELKHRSVPAADTERRAIDESPQSDGAQSMRARSQRVKQHTDDRSESAPRRVAK